MITPETHVGDDLTIIVTVKKPGGTIMDITDATVDAKAMLGDISVVPVSVTVTDGPGGKIVADFGQLLSAPGLWNIQVRVAMDDRQTVLDDLHSVLQSIL